MYKTIAEIKAANAAYAERAGRSHWFGPEERRFFSTRVSRWVYGGRYFVTSEQFSPYTPGNPRRYSIRRASDDGSIDTIGEFQAYATAREAATAVIAHLRTNP